MNGQTETQNDVLEPEVVKDEIEKRSPAVPATINELAALEDQGEAIVGAAELTWESSKTSMESTASSPRQKGKTQ